MRDLPARPTLHDLQTHIAEACRKRGWDQRLPAEEFMLFVEEIGELAKELRRSLGLHGNKSKASQVKSEIEDEFADVLIYLLAIANRYGVDLTNAYRNKMKINDARTWD